MDRLALDQPRRHRRKADQGHGAGDARTDRLAEGLGDIAATHHARQEDDDRDADLDDRDQAYGKYPIGIEGRPDGVLRLVAVARGDDDGVAEIPQQLLGFVGGQRPAQFAFTRLDPRHDFIAQLGDDIVALGFRQQARHGAQIVFQHVHYPPMIVSSEALIVRHSRTSRCNMSSPAGDRT